MIGGSYTNELYLIIGLLFGIGILIAMYFLFRKVRERFESKGTVTLYYMKGCGHCEKFKDEWEKFKIMAADKGNVATASKEAGSDREAVEAAGVTGFPTIRYTDPSGKSTDYQGDRTAIALSTWVDSQQR